MSEWQPIETAPKDGTVVVLTFDNTKHFNSDPITAFPMGGQWCGCESGNYIDLKPTHWMPLPKPPKE